jgi:hypothetical protein
MSDAEIEKITDRAGTGAPNFTYGLNSGGSDSGLAGFAYTASGTEPSSPANGDVWFDTANDKYYTYINGEFKQLTHVNPDNFTWGGDRGMWAAGDNTNVIQYVSLSTLGNATDFGDATAQRQSPAGCSDSTYGLVAGGNSGATQYQSIDYFTISTTANAADFGDMTVIRKALAALSDGTYGVFGGGFSNSGGQSYEDTMDYVTVASTGNATDFGNLTVARQFPTGASNGTRGLFGGGRDETVGYVNTIDYITVSTTGNATDFGDLTVARWTASASDQTYAVYGGGSQSSNGNTIDYVTMASTGNATDFGDMLTAMKDGTMSACGDDTKVAWGGGNNPSSASNVIQYVTVSTTGNAQDFGDLLSTVTYSASLSGDAS